MPKASSITVIVAEDQLTMRTLVKSALQSIGVENVRLVQDGVQALLQIHKEVPSLLLTDVNMPNLDGLGLLKTVRQTPSIAAMPVILLTGAADRDVVSQAVSLKVNNFIVKPFTGEKLREKIEAVVGKFV